jgi:heptosyltransferase-3
VREWLKQSWEQLVQQLQKKGYTNIIQIGTSQHTLTLGASEGKLINGVYSLVDQMTLDETIALISLAQVFVGIDSGMLHIAASVGTKSVGIWGATSARFLSSPTNRKHHIVSSVPCQGCHHRVPREHWITGCPYEIRCMKEITVEKVLEKVDEIIREKIAKSSSSERIE